MATKKTAYRNKGMRPPARSHPGGVAPVRRDVSASQT